MRQRSSLLVLALGLLTGCGIAPSPDAISPVASPVVPVVLSGVVHGGQNPVSGATIQLWQAGATGYGQGAAKLGSSTMTLANGSFNITGDYTCPSSSTLVYLTATGGDPGSGPNSAISMMVALGPCGPLPTTPFISINEATTVASVYALAQFMSPSGSIGSFSSSTTGLTNAFATVNNLVSTASGAALSATPGGIGVAPQQEINSLANSLAACVNSIGPASTACSTLFSNAKPSGGAAPATVLAAALDIALNPGNNVAAIYNVAPATPPFLPVLNAAPNDWTMALSFASGGQHPYALALDSVGNVWIANHGNTGGSTSSISWMTNLGVQAANNPLSNSGDINGVKAIAVDGNNNAWIANNGNSTGMEFNAALNGSSYTINILGTPLSNGLTNPDGIAVDANNNIWFANSGSNSVTEYFSGSGGSTFTTYTGGGLNTPAGLAIDMSGNVWAANSVSNGTGSLTQITSSGISNVVGGGLSQPTSVAVDGSGDVWATDASLSEIAEFNSGGGALSSSSGYTGGGLSDAFGDAIDGGGNLWVADYAGNHLTELNSSGTPITPSTGYQGGSLASPRSLAIDASGDIWVANNNPVTSPVNSQPQTVTEFVGLATPAHMPLQQGLTTVGGVGSRPGTLILPPPQLSTWYVNIANSITETANGGSGSYTYAITSGLNALQAIGLGFTPSGTLSGTPTGPGVFPFTIQVTDTYGDKVSVNATLVVNSVTSLQLSLSDPNPAYNEAVTLTATVQPAGATFTGTISFYEDPGMLASLFNQPQGILLASVNVTNQTSAQWSQQFLGGNHTVYAVLSGGTNLQSSVVNLNVTSALAVPANGIYLGLAVSGGLNSVEVYPSDGGIGRPVALNIQYPNVVGSTMHDWYQLPQELNADGTPNWDSNLQNDIDNARVPVISWDCDGIDSPLTSLGTDYDLAMGNPTEKYAVVAVAQLLKQYPGPVLFRWKWEFNGTTWAFHTACDGASESSGWTTKEKQSFVGAWQEMWTIFQQQGATNVVFDWNPYKYVTGNSVDPKGFYPGDTFVDWIGIDAYQGKNDPTGPFSADISTWYNDYQSHNKPMIIGENGAANYQAATPTPQEVQWSYIKGTLADFQANDYPLVHAYCWFDENPNSALDNDNGNTPDDGGLTAMTNLGASSLFSQTSLTASGPLPTTNINGSTYSPPINIINNGLLPLTSVEVTSISISVVSGNGPVTLSSSLPVSVTTVAGATTSTSLEAGQTGTITPIFNWPASATCVQMTIGYSAVEGNVTLSQKKPPQATLTPYNGQTTIKVSRLTTGQCT